MTEHADTYPTIRILCYGDSNTWGTIPRYFETTVPSERYDENTRWTKVMGKLLGEGYTIFEEGLGGRTTIYGDDPDNWFKNGRVCLRALLGTHRQLDLVIFMLGTNDIHQAEPLPMEEMGKGIAELIKIVQDAPNCGRGYRAAKILVIAPPEVRPSAPNGRVGVYPRFFGDYGRKQSLMFPEVYKKVAGEYGCYYLNSQEFAEPGEGDGVHLTPESHKKLAAAVADCVKTIFAENRSEEASSVTVGMDAFD